MTTPEFNQFVDLVRQMRETQKLYFETRDREILDRSKNLERRVDRAILAIESPDLFESMREHNAPKPKPTEPHKAQTIRVTDQ